MNSRSIMICLTATSISSLLLFFYFKNKISSVEEKLDSMFQLIQNYAAETQKTQNEAQWKVQETIPQYTEPILQEVNNNNNTLITVSDNESESDSDSESDGDSESGGGSDSGSDSGSETDVENKDNTHNQNSSIKTIQKMFSKPSNLQSGLDDIMKEETPVILLGGDNKNEQEKTEELEDEEEDSLDEVDDDEEEDEDEEEEEEEEEDDDEEEDDGKIEFTLDPPEDEEVVKKVSVNKDINYDILRVTDLKGLARDRGLSGYRNLRKQELIDLLSQ